MKRAIIIAMIVFTVIIAIISAFYIVKNTKNDILLNNVEETFSSSNLQSIVKPTETTNENQETKENETEETNATEITKDNLVLQIDGESVLGVLTIEKIGFRGLVYEGTALSTLDKGIGHFENSPYFEGNVCFAGHNSKNNWSELHTMEHGDIITYVSFMGEKKYAVNNLVEIDETDWSLLTNTEQNMITLITCVRNQPFKRLAVQAIEVD